MHFSFFRQSIKFVNTFSWISFFIFFADTVMKCIISFVDKDMICITYFADIVMK